MTQQTQHSPTARLTHVALHVKNLDSAIEFYQNYCDMRVIHTRGADSGSPIVWMSEPGREQDMVFVLMGKGYQKSQATDDYSHLGFALSSTQEVDEIALKAKQDQCLVWEPRQEPYPVGYYCGVKDPSGNYVEFSYGQPLGPGAKAIQ